MLAEALEKMQKSFELNAKLGSPTYGICSNQFLNENFRTESYWYKLNFNGDKSISYEQNTSLRINGQDKIFDHKDSNTLFRT